jgi:hypothetical protein
MRKAKEWLEAERFTKIQDCSGKESFDFLAFRDIQRFSYTSWACATTVLYAKPGNAALRTAIEMIVDNCQGQYYGITPLCPTGPTLLGAALAANGADCSSGNFPLGVPSPQFW